MVQDFLKPKLNNFIQTIGYGGHSFTFHFRLGGEKFEKNLTIINPDLE